MEDLLRCGDVALVGGQGGEGLQELGVAVVLARVGLGESLLSSGEFDGELRAVVTFIAPGDEEGEA